VQLNAHQPFLTKLYESSPHLPALTWCRHVVTGWSIASRNKEMVYEIHFRRLASEPSMEIVLRRPFSDEIEDYREYKRIRQAVRLAQHEASGAERGGVLPSVNVSCDGALEELGDDFSDLEAHDSFVVIESRWASESKE
jgi:hypothetical protein